MSKFNPRRPIRKGITLGQGIVFLVDEIIESKKHWWLRSNEHKRKQVIIMHKNQTTSWNGVILRMVNQHIPKLT